MLSPTALWTASNAISGRTPIYRVKFAGITQEYSTQPVKANWVDEALADGPNAGWRFGEASGVSAIDVSGNGLTGTYQNAPTLSVTGALVGDSNTAVTLNGTQWISVPTNVLLNPGDVVTLSAWVYIGASFGANYMIFDKGVNSAQVYIAVTTGFVTFVKSGVANICVSTVAPPLNQWNMITVVKNGVSSKIYINAVDVSGAITNQTIVANASALGIGATSGGVSAFLVGSIDEAFIYANPLSALRIQQQYDAGRRLLNRRAVSPYVRKDSLAVGTSQVIPERGQSSIGALTFTLNDIGDEVSEILADSPRGFYRCGDLSGTVATDSSGNARNGVYA